MGLFSDLFSNDNAEEAARLKREGITKGLNAANSALDTGYTTAQGYYDRALTPFSDLYAKGSKGYDTYLDATGANGAEGIARAGDLYKMMPGYTAGQTTGLDLLERRAAARGDLGGGNTAADTIKFASDYDAQKYKDFVSGLTGNAGVATSAASGQAGVLGQQGNLASSVGSQKAGYGYQAATGIGNAQADAEMAKQQASANFWSALMGGANLATKAFGPFSFGGGAAMNISPGTVGGTGLPGYGGLY